MVRLLRAADYRRMPWKNGGGETREILVSPAGASLDALEWRVSLAAVASDGPFSEFRGITRTLSVIRGAGITLRVGGGPSRQLLQSSEPCTFDGETPTSASLIDGPIVDLNVMSRRGVARHRVSRMRPEGTSQLATSADVTLVFCSTGSARCGDGETSVELSAEDCALIERKPSIAGRLGGSVENGANVTDVAGVTDIEGITHVTGVAELFVIELYREFTRSSS